MELTLTPAYGRDYKNKAAVLKDWEAGKDFEIADPGYHRYCNKADLERDSKVTGVRLRYAGLRKVALIKLA